MKKCMLVAATASFVVAAAALSWRPGTGHVQELPTHPAKPFRFQAAGLDSISANPSDVDFGTCLSPVRSKGSDMMDELDARRAWAELEAAGHTPDVFRSLESSDGEERRSAAALLEAGRPKGAAQALAAALVRETDTEARRAMVAALAGMEDDEAGPSLVCVWRSGADDPIARRLALQGLACLGHPEALDAWFRRVIRDEDQQVVESGFARALTWRGLSDSSLRQAVLVIAVESPRESSRLEAAEALTARP